MTITLAMRVSAYDDSDVVMMIALPHVVCEVRLFVCDAFAIFFCFC